MAKPLPKVLVQKTASGEYFAVGGKWLVDETKALDFVSGSEALRFVIQQKWYGVQVVLQFPNFRFKVNMSGFRDHMPPNPKIRPGQRSRESI